MTNNPYTVLGISESATQDEIKAAYRKKAKENHPDLHPNDPNAGDRMNEINEAYSVLSNPEKLAQWKASQQGPVFENMYGGFNPYAQQNPNQDPFDGQNPFAGQNPFGTNGQFYRSGNHTYYYYSTGSRPSNGSSYKPPSLGRRILRGVLTYAVLSFFLRMIFRGGFLFLPFFFF